MSYSTLPATPHFFIAPIRPSLRVAITFLSLITFCFISSRTFAAAQLSGQESSNGSGTYVGITAATLSFDSEVAKRMALGWVFSPKSERPYFVEPDSDETPGRMAAILTTSLYIVSMAKRVNAYKPVPPLKIANGSHCRIYLPDGQSAEVTASVPPDGMTANIIIALSEPNALSADQTRTVRAILRDGQAVILGEIAIPGQPYTTTNNGAKFLLLDVSIIDLDGKHLHDWEERGAKRFYWDINKPYARPIIATTIYGQLSGLLIPAPQIAARMDRNANHRTNNVAPHHQRPVNAR